MYIPIKANINLLIKINIASDNGPVYFYENAWNNFRHNKLFNQMNGESANLIDQKNCI